MRTEKEIEKEIEFWSKVLNNTVVNNHSISDEIKTVIKTLNWVKGKYDDSGFYNLYDNKKYYDYVEIEEDD